MAKWIAVAGFAMSMGAACSSSSTDGGVGGADGGSVDFDVPNYANIAALGDANARAVERAVASSPTAAADIPSGGTARFAGPILVVDQDDGAVDTTISGGMEILVNFANAGSIDGEASNFFDVDGTPVEGTLALSDATTVDLTVGEGFDARLRGRINGVGAGTDTADVVYDISLTETYVGSGVQILLGSGLGAAAPVGGGEASSVSVSSISERR